MAHVSVHGTCVSEASKKDSEKIVIFSLTWNYFLIIVTTGKSQRISLHVGRTSSEKGAIDTFLGS